jgi:hypothetical protein
MVQTSTVRIDPAAYTYSATLLAPSCKLYWSIVGSTFNGGLECQTLGWVAFGLTNQAGMAYVYCPVVVVVVVLLLLLLLFCRVLGCPVRGGVVTAAAAVVLSCACDAVLIHEIGPRCVCLCSCAFFNSALFDRGCDQAAA